MGARTRKLTVTIADSGTESGALDLQSRLRADEAIVGIEFPAGFDGTTLTFKNAVDGSNYFTVLKTDGTTYTITCAASRYVVIPPADLKGLTNIKAVAGAQTGAVTLSFIAATVS